MFLAENPNYAALGENVQAFINGCLEVCWLSAIQDPPLAFDWNFPEGSDVADKVVKLFTKSGTKVDFVVWPVMKLHVDGDILSKGVVQPIPEEKIKKKKESLSKEWSVRQNDYKKSQDLIHAYSLTCTLPVFWK